MHYLDERLTGAVSQQAHWSSLGVPWGAWSCVEGHEWTVDSVWWNIPCFVVDISTTGKLAVYNVHIKAKTWGGLTPCSREILPKRTLCLEVNEGDMERPGNTVQLCFEEVHSPVQSVESESFNFIRTWSTKYKCMLKQVHWTCEHYFLHSQSHCYTPSSSRNPIVSCLHQFTKWKHVTLRSHCKQISNHHS